MPGQAAERQWQTGTLTSGSPDSQPCPILYGLSRTHSHTQTHRTMAVIPCLQPQGLRNGPCPLYPWPGDRSYLSPHRQHPVPHPTDLIYHCRLDFWETQAHVGTTETPKYGARTPNRPSIPKKGPLVLRVSWDCCRELISQVQKRPLAPKYLPSQEIPSPNPSEIDCWDRLPPEVLVSSLPGSHS